MTEKTAQFSKVTDGGHTIVYEWNQATKRYIHTLRPATKCEINRFLQKEIDARSNITALQYALPVVEND